MAIPGIVLGLSYVIFFHGMPIYGTILLIALANTIRFFASPYLMNLQLPQQDESGFRRRWTDSRRRKTEHHSGCDTAQNQVDAYRDVHLLFCQLHDDHFCRIVLGATVSKADRFDDQSVWGAAFVSLLILLIDLVLKIILSIFRNRSHLWTSPIKTDNHKNHPLMVERKRTTVRGILYAKELQVCTIM